MRYVFTRSWRRKNKKGLFGGDIKSKEEIAALNKKIEFHEEKEMQKANKALEEELKRLA